MIEFCRIRPVSSRIGLRLSRVAVRPSITLRRGLGPMTRSQAAGTTGEGGLSSKAARRATPRHIRDSMSFRGDSGTAGGQRTAVSAKVPFGCSPRTNPTVRSSTCGYGSNNTMSPTCWRIVAVAGARWAIVDGWRAENKMRAGRGEICSSGYARDMTEADRGHRALNQPHPGDREAELYAPIAEEGPDLFADRDVRESASALAPPD